MAYSLVWPRDWEPGSENWKQILSRDEYQIPDTTKEILRDHCGIIEVMYQIELTGYLYTEEEGQRKEKLFKDYKDLGMRVVNEAGKIDWNGVEKNLEEISNEMKEIKNGADRERWKEEDEKLRTLLDLYGKGQGMKINAETLEGEVVTVKNVTRFDLVRDVKDQIATRLGKKNPDEIILLHQQVELKDTETLDSYGITDGTTIHVIPRVRGKGYVESARGIFDHAKSYAKRLIKFAPGFLADITRAVTERELVKISTLIGNGWEILGGILGISQVKIEHIKADNQTIERQILDMLITWLYDINNEATVGKLYQAMNECKSMHFEKDEIHFILSDFPLSIFPILEGIF